MIARKKSRGTLALLRSLADLEKCVRDGISPQARFPARTAVAVPKPVAYPPAAVVRLRKRIGVSQAGFAELLGVSRILVQSWERGVRSPSAMACRLMGTIEHDPASWLASIRGKRRAS